MRNLLYFPLDFQWEIFIPLFIFPPSLPPPPPSSGGAVQHAGRPPSARPIAALTDARWRVELLLCGVPEVRRLREGYLHLSWRSQRHPVGVHHLPWRQVSLHRRQILLPHRWLWKCDDPAKRCSSGCPTESGGEWQGSCRTRGPGMDTKMRSNIRVVLCNKLCISFFQVRYWALGLPSALPWTWNFQWKILNVYWNQKLPLEKNTRVSFFQIVCMSFANIDWNIENSKTWLR